MRCGLASVPLSNRLWAAFSPILERLGAFEKESLSFLSTLFDVYL